jgi:hypothetical protein
LQFVGGNSLGGGLGQSDFYISDGANNISILGWNFGYGSSGAPAKYAIEDVGNGVNNAIIGCTFEESSYSQNVLSDVVRDYWSVIGCNIDSKPLANADSSSTNLLINGGFDKFRAGLPLGWINVSNNGSSFEETVDARSASAIRYVASPVDATQGIQQTLDITPGALMRKVVVVSGDFKASGSTDVFLQIREGVNVQEIPIPRDEKWRRLRLYRKITTDGNVTVRLELKRIGDGGGTSTLIADNVSMVIGNNADVVGVNPSDCNIGMNDLEEVSTPSVRGVNNCYLSGSVAVTSFLNAYEGKTIVVVGNGSATVIHGSNIILRSGSDITLAADAAMMLRFIGGKWREV